MGGKLKPFLIFFFYILTAHAQTLSPGGRTKALHSQSALILDNAGTVFTNPALLPQLPLCTTWFNVFNPYQLKEVQSIASAINYSNGVYGIGIGFWQLGHKLYKEQIVNLALSRAIFHDVSAGITVKYRRIDIARYGSAGHFLFDLGIHVPLSSKMNFGARLVNFHNTALAESGDEFKRELISALKIATIPDINLYIETAHVESQTPDLRFAATYSPIDFLQLRAGTGLNSSEIYSMGFCVNWNRMSFDYALQNHTYLAQTHYFTFSLEIK
ncbi:MAG: hypothetical protein DWQ05_05525 [Calditrichaeota bacterium]|nr:MAG: hypothetical protein DWQ05_05525 [Calditrichota bacterium]